MRMMAGNVTFSIDELARNLDTSYRSIYRYIDTFKQCGFAVEKVHGNVYRILEMPSQFKDLSNLVYFSEEEARIVNQLIDNLSETNALKIDLKKKLSAVYDDTAFDRYVETSSNAANIQALGHAIRDRRRVLLKDYSSANSGTVKDRLVEPFAFTPRYIDVYAYDVEDGECKQFKIARIGWVDTLPDRWECEDRHRKGYLDAFRMQGDTQTHVRLEMTLRAKDLLCEEYPLAIPDVSEGKNGKWVFDSMVSRMEGVGRFVMGLAKEVDIIDCPELRKYIADYRRETLSRFEE